mmetsp:Transcript_30213/g.51082  ORF Transcript_30213/g.51082 Transcript_30213/m.51082 type:complete len:80 (-) Transcript_30213:396-635(-)
MTSGQPRRGPVGVPGAAQPFSQGHHLRTKCSMQDSPPPEECPATSVVSTWAAAVPGRLYSTKQKVQKDKEKKCTRHFFV